MAVPSSPTLRQRIHALADSGEPALTALDEANERLLRRAKSTFTPLSTGHLALDFDVFTLDNSGTAKEGVGRTYMGFDGYAPTPDTWRRKATAWVWNCVRAPSTRPAKSRIPQTIAAACPRSVESSAPGAGGLGFRWCRHLRGDGRGPCIGIAGLAGEVEPARLRYRRPASRLAADPATLRCFGGTHQCRQAGVGTPRRRESGIHAGFDGSVSYQFRSSGHAQIKSQAQSKSKSHSRWRWQGVGQCG